MRALPVWISFFITHHFSLNFRHLSLITRYLKYPNFPNPTRLALIIQFCVTLFPKKIKNKKQNKKKKSNITAGLCFKKKKKKPKKSNIAAEQWIYYKNAIENWVLETEST